VSYHATIEASGDLASSNIFWALPFVTANTLLLLLTSATTLLLASALSPALAPPLTPLLASGNCRSRNILNSMACQPHLLVDKFAGENSKVVTIRAGLKQVNGNLILP
jgi:hypothetical protein